MSEMRIKLNGKVLVVNDIHDYGYLPIVVLDDGQEWYIAEDSDHAGREARQYWEDMADNDPEELRCIIGDDTLVKWALGEWAGPGSTKVKSLSDWLDLWLDTPEENFAGYDGTEVDVERVGKLAEELGFTPTVAYRHN